MTEKRPLILAAALGFMSMPLAGAQAEGLDIPGEFSANVAITTNYIYRGVTQTDDGPAIQGGFDYANGIFYAGTWASSVDFGDDTTLEIDWYAGLASEFNGVGFDVGVLYYTYPDSPDMPTQDFLELYAGASGTVAEVVDLSTKISYSPDFYLETGEAWYAEVGIGVPLGEFFGLDAHYGFSTFQETGTDDYSDWNIGLTASVEGFDLDLRYYDTTDRIGGSMDDAVVFSISRSFN